MDAVTSVALGRFHGCAVGAGGVVSCWGLGAQGQLGDAPAGLSQCPVPSSLATEAEVMTPTAPCATVRSPVTLPAPATAVYAGDFHTCAVLTDSTLWCWGRNDRGQLGVMLIRARPGACGDDPDLIQ